MSQSVMPVLFGRMIDAMDKGDTRAERTKAYTKACLELAIVVGGGLVFTAIRAYIFNSSGVRVVARLRVLLFKAMLAQETAWFDASETGDLLSRLASDTAKLQAAATETVSLLMRNLVLTLVSLVLLFTTSWRLTLLALGIVPCLCGVTFAARRGVRRRRVLDARRAKHAGHPRRQEALDGRADGARPRGRRGAGGPREREGRAELRRRGVGGDALRVRRGQPGRAQVPRRAESGSAQN